MCWPSARYFFSVLECAARLRKRLIERLRETRAATPETLMQLYLDAVLEPWYGRLVSWALLSDHESKQSQAALLAPELRLIADASHHLMQRRILTMTRAESEALIVALWSMAIGYVAGNGFFWRALEWLVDQPELRSRRVQSCWSKLRRMRIAEYDRFGRADVTIVRDRPLPRPSAGQVLVRVRAAALNPKDVIVRSGKVPLLALSGFPKYLGYDFAGEIESVGRSVQHVRVGDAVFGMLNGARAGTLAEYCIAPEDELFAKPATLSWQEAAALPLTSLTALQALRDDAQLLPGQRVLINGASGGVGVMAIQIAKALGAHVTSVSSAHNRQLCASLGSDVWLDYASGGVFDGAARYDVIFDVFGNQSFARAKQALTRRGHYVSTVPKAHVVMARLRTLLAERRAHLVIVRSRARDLALIAELVAQGKLRAIVHGTFELEQAAQAQLQVESKHTRGKVVITV